MEKYRHRMVGRGRFGRRRTARFGPHAGRRHDGRGFEPERSTTVGGTPAEFVQDERAAGGRRAEARCLANPLVSCRIPAVGQSCAGQRGARSEPPSARLGPAAGGLGDLDGDGTIDLLGPSPDRLREADVSCRCTRFREAPGARCGRRTSRSLGSRTCWHWTCGTWIATACPRSFSPPDVTGGFPLG